MEHNFITYVNLFHIQDIYVICYPFLYKKRI
nr:MAG TPA: hypothetical protein [Caudoviricetes sp.]